MSPATTKYTRVFLLVTDILTDFNQIWGFSTAVHRSPLYEITRKVA